MTNLHLLVMTSCTKSKRWSPAAALQQDDFRDQRRLFRREEALSQYRCRADQMYMGRQHLYVMEGVRLLRASGVKVALSIVSAGYGLIAEDREIVPYEWTFDGMGRKQTRQWARQLRIPSAVRTAIESYPLVFFLLSDDYLTAVDPPIDGQGDQRLIFFTRPAEKRLTGSGTTIVPAGLDLCSVYHSGTVAIKVWRWRS